MKISLFNFVFNVQCLCVLSMYSRHNCLDLQWEAFSIFLAERIHITYNAMEVFKCLRVLRIQYNGSLTSTVLYPKTFKHLKGHWESLLGQWNIMVYFNKRLTWQPWQLWICLCFFFRHDCQDGSDENDCDYSHLAVNKNFFCFRWRWRK